MTPVQVSNKTVDAEKNRSEGQRAFNELIAQKMASLPTSKTSGETASSAGTSTDQVSATPVPPLPDSQSSGSRDHAPTIVNSAPATRAPASEDSSAATNGESGKSPAGDAPKSPPADEDTDDKESQVPHVYKILRDGAKKPIKGELSTFCSRCRLRVPSHHR